MDRETPNGKTKRIAKEAKIRDYHRRGDSYQSDGELDTYPHGESRKELGVVAMYQTLKRKGSKAARFFEKEAIEEASQPTEEIPIVA